MKAIQLIDSLHAGGAERVALNLANSLANKIEGSYLCVTREEGLLKSSLKSDDKYLFLNKKSTFDFSAIKRFHNFIKKHKIEIIHAHSSSFFMATLIKLFNNKIKVVWHDHYGNSEFLIKRGSKVLKLCSRYFDHVVCVNKNLENWSKQYLKVKDVTYLPNFAVNNNVNAQTSLFGEEKQRIICLANLRPQKDHFTLIEAFKNVVRKHPKWSLHLVGKDFKDDYASRLLKEIEDNKLGANIFLYGSRPDISNILDQCEIGVLSSKSEGLPIALLEYGLASLAVITTKVGECVAVVESKTYGILINSEDKEQLSNSISYLIENEDIRLKKAKAFNEKVQNEYSENTVINKIINIYNKISK